MTADKKQANSNNPNLKRRSTIASDLAKGTRASTRIRKQRIVQCHEYSEEEEDDPFADNSDADSNYSEHIGTYAGKEIICGGGRRKRNKKNKNTKKTTLQSKVGRKRNNTTIPSKQPSPVTYTEGITSIPHLNKNAVTRGTDGTRVATMSHWLSLDKHFTVGKFVMHKRDKPLLNSTQLTIWRIDGKSMLQKYEAFIDELTGGIKFKAVKMYSGWSPLHTDDYALVPVTGNRKEQHAQTIVQIDASETIDIDSDE